MMKHLKFYNRKLFRPFIGSGWILKMIKSIAIRELNSADNGFAILIWQGSEVKRLIGFKEENESKKKKGRIELHRNLFNQKLSPGVRSI